MLKEIESDHPTVNIPKNMKETQYPGYYVTEDGRVFRRPGKYDKNGRFGRVDENGLIYLKPSFRGNPRYPEHQYECVNISVYDENKKYKQIKKSIHQLVAESFVPNPNNHREIDHIDKNKSNNHYTNLRWISRYENSSEPNHKTYTITDIVSGKVWKGNNLRVWAQENYDFLKSRWRKKNDRSIKDIGDDLSWARTKQRTLWSLKIEY